MEKCTVKEEMLEFEVRGEKYTAYEPSEGAAKAYKAKQWEGAKLVDGSVTRDNMASVADLPSFLVSQVVKDKDGKQVTLDAVLSWPTRIVRYVSRWAEEFLAFEDSETSIQEQIVRLQRRLEEKPKNSQSATETPSK